MPLEVDMRVVDRDALETYDAIGSVIEEILREGQVERTPRISELVRDLSTLVVYALATRKYRGSEAD